MTAISFLVNQSARRQPRRGDEQLRLDALSRSVDALQLAIRDANKQLALARQCFASSGTDTPMLEYVLTELRARKGTWTEIAKELEPDSWASYYSWLTKLAQDRIPDPSVNKIQRLADYFRAQHAKQPAAA